MQKGAFTLKKTVWQLLIKLTIHLIHDPTVPLLGIHTSTQKLGHDMQNSIICNIPKLRKQPKYSSVGEWKKPTVEQSYSGMLLNNKEVQTLTHTTMWKKLKT